VVVVNEARKRGFVTTAQRVDHAPIVGHRDWAYGSSGNPACGGGGWTAGRGAVTAPTTPACRWRSPVDPHRAAVHGPSV
jgi:hypothetical protein